MLIGPGGVVVATPIPFHGPPFVVGDVLYIGSRPLTRWFATRWWEATWLNDRLAEAVEDFPWEDFTWDGPTYPLAVATRPPAPVRDAVPLFSRLPLGHWPPVWGNATVRTDHTAPPLGRGDPGAPATGDGGAAGGQGRGTLPTRRHPRTGISCAALLNGSCRGLLPAVGDAVGVADSGDAVVGGEAAGQALRPSQGAAAGAGHQVQLLGRVRRAIRSRPPSPFQYPTR